MAVMETATETPDAGAVGCPDRTFNQNLLVTTAASASVGTGLSGSAATVTVIAKNIVQAKVESGAKINQNNREHVTKQSKVKVIAMDATEADAAAAARHRNRRCRRYRCCSASYQEGGGGSGRNHLCTGRRGSECSQ